MDEWNIEHGFDILADMRRLRETEAHAARAALIEGQYPKGMQARCSFCARVEPVESGEMIEVNPTGLGPTKVFRCSACSETREDSAA